VAGVLYNTTMEKKRKDKSRLEATNSEVGQEKNPNSERIIRSFDQVSYYQAKRANLLLGEFSADGKYVFKDEKLMQELVSLPKVLQERVDNVVYAFTKYKGYNLNFKVELDISESYCQAELYLIEIEHQLDEDVKHLTSLGNFVEIYSPSFKENVYKTWNINLQETPLDKDSDVFYRLKELDGEYHFNKELIEILSQLYIVRLLKLLDNCGTLGLKIQGDYRAYVEELVKKDPSLAQDHTRLKQILDKVVAKHNGFETILEMKGGAEILRDYSEPIDRVRGKSGPILVEGGGEKEENKPEEKTVAKKQDASKKKKSKAKGGSNVKPFVYDFKNYKPMTLGSVEDAKKVLPSKETIAEASPIMQAATVASEEKREIPTRQQRPTSAEEEMSSPISGDISLEELFSSPEFEDLPKIVSFGRMERSEIYDDSDVLKEEPKPFNTNPFSDKPKETGDNPVHNEPNSPKPKAEHEEELPSFRPFNL